MRNISERSAVSDISLRSRRHRASGISLFYRQCQEEGRPSAGSIFKSNPACQYLRQFFRDAQSQAKVGFIRMGFIRAVEPVENERLIRLGNPFPVVCHQKSQLFGGLSGLDFDAAVFRGVGDGIIQKDA